MELSGARVLVAGATGEIGSRLARGLAAGGARVSLAGRNGDRLANLARELGAPSRRFDARDPSSCAEAVDGAAAELGGLDALVIATGATAFGSAPEVEDAATRELFEANLFGPMALIRAALGRIEGKGAIVGLSAIVADYPTADMAAYSASKAAFSAYLATVRREYRRQGLVVLDVRPQHMETGFSDRPISGEPPKMPEPADVDRTVETILGALRAGKREISYDLQAKQLVVS
jgi:short-subunit dehydrogenase